jgi:hypothetical protein
VPEDLPQQLRHAIADTLASTRTGSNSDFFDSDHDDDNYQGSTGFAKLQKMQRFLRISDYLLNDEPCNTTSPIASTAMSSHGHERNNRIPT